MISFLQHWHNTRMAKAKNYQTDWEQENQKHKENNTANRSTLLSIISETNMPTPITQDSNWHLRHPPRQDLIVIFRLVIPLHLILILDHDIWANYDIDSRILRLMLRLRLDWPPNILLHLRVHLRLLILSRPIKILPHTLILIVSLLLMIEIWLLVKIILLSSTEIRIVLRLSRHSLTHVHCILVNTAHWNILILHSTYLIRHLSVHASDLIMRYHWRGRVWSVLSILDARVIIEIIFFGWHLVIV